MSGGNAKDWACFFARVFCRSGILRGAFCHVGIANVAFPRCGLRLSEARKWHFSGAEVVQWRGKSRTEGRQGGCVKMENFEMEMFNL